MGGLHQPGSDAQVVDLISWMSRWKLGSMVRINGLFHLLINVKWGILGL